MKQQDQDDGRGWLDYVILALAVLAIVVWVYVLLGPQIAPQFQNISNSLDYTPSP